MNFIDLLNSPTGYVLLSAVAFATLAFFVLRMGPKREKVQVIERIRPMDWKIFPASLKRKKNPGELMLRVSDSREFIIPDEKQDKYSRVEVLKGIRKGVTKFFIVESGQVVEPSQQLATQANPVLDHGTVSAVVNRTSARRLASGPLLAGKGIYLWLAMGAIVGISIGWILYPQFNHLPPVLECFERIGNGSYVPSVCH